MPILLYLDFIVRLFLIALGVIALIIVIYILLYLVVLRKIKFFREIFG